MTGPKRVAALVILILMLTAASQAFAADLSRPGSSEVVFIAQVMLLLVCGRLLGEAMQRIGQPAVTGQLVAGILLGPSVFGALLPSVRLAIFPDGGGHTEMIDAVSQFGILMLLFLTGMETDLSIVKQVKRAAVMASVAGISLPFACGFALGFLMPDQMLPDPGRRLITALFLGTALAVSSVKIVALVVREMGFLRRLVGQVIVASAIIDDTIGWIIMAVTFGIARHGSVDIGTVGQSILGTGLFLVASFTIGPRIVFLLIRWTNDNFVTEFPVITVVLLLMGMMALITYAIGVNTVLGAFVAGILAGQSPILTKHIQEQLRGLIVALFMPIFFGVAGLHTDLSALANGPMLLLALGMILIASIGKFSGALVGGRLGGMTSRELLALACGMNARGSTEVIVATLGMTAGVLNQALFTTIVVMAVVTTMAMPPTLRWALARVPLRPDEKARLEREAAEARGFVSNLERMLIAVDSGPTGRLASRLAGTIAGNRQIETTTLPVDETPETTEEAKKGYDLLIVGVDPPHDENRFSGQEARLAIGFDGPFVLVVARGHHLEDPERVERDILVPVTGTNFSRHGAEVAMALAQANDATVTALYVVTRSKARSDLQRGDGTGQHNGEAVLREIVELGEQQGVIVNAIVRRGVPEVEIPRQLASGQHDLIVMGVSRRPGDALFFGEVPDAVLDQAGRSVVLVSSQG